MRSRVHPSLVRASLAVLLATVCASSAGAQQTIVRRPTAVLAPADSVRGPVRTAPEAPAIRKDAVLTTGMPRSYLVVSVTVPIELPAGSPIAYEVLSTGKAAIIGRRAGVLSGDDARRVVMVTIGIPAMARAGRMVGAVVAFSGQGLEKYEVPVEIEVAAVHRVVLTTTAELRGARVGDRIDLRYRVRNAGNVRDTIRMRITPPEEWRFREQTSGPLVLDPGVEEERVVRLFVPDNSSTGNFFVKLEASAGDEQQTQTAMLEVIDRTTGGIPVGPSLTAGLAAVAGGGSGTGSMVSLDVNGPMSSSVQIDGRLALSTTTDPAATRGFSRVNSFVTSPYLSAWGTDWRASAGNTAVGFSELTGVNAWGTGLTGSYAFGTNSVSAVAALPSAGPFDQDRGELLGVTYRTSLGPLRMGASATHLSDGQVRERELSALGVTATVFDLPVGTLSGELAYRDFRDGGGLGWSAEAVKGQGKNLAQLRVMHAPGGTDAFARVRSEINGTFNRSLNARWDITGAFYATRDSNQSFPRMETKAASVMQQYRLGSATTVSLEARTSSFTANSLDEFVPSFGNSERRVAGLLTASRGAFGYTGELGLESVSRTADFNSDVHSDLTGTRAVWRGSVDWVTKIGMFQAEHGYEYSAPGSGFLPRQMTAVLRADRVRMSLLPRDVYMSGEVQYQSWGVARSSATIYRVGADLPLRSGFELSMHAEHNPLFSTGGAGAGWVFSMKLQRGTSLPRLRLSMSSGVVFQDLNANNVREPGEPGVGNVVVRQGDARTTTSADGRYQFYDKTRGMPSVELSSLPYGWVTGELPTRIDATVRDIALIPTSNIEIVLSVVADSSGRIPDVDLSQVGVFARDARGREWQARRSGNDTAVFDALPLGHYELEFEFSALSEPLRTQGKPTFDVTGRSTQRLTIPLLGRPLRFFRPQNRPTPASNAAPASDSAAAQPVPNSTGASNRTGT